MKRIVNFGEDTEPANELDFATAAAGKNSHKHPKKKQKAHGKADHLADRKLDHKAKRKEMLAFRKQLPIYSGKFPPVASITS